MEKKIKLVDRIRRKRHLEVEHGVEIKRVNKRKRVIQRQVERNLGIETQLTLGGPGYSAEELDEY